MHVQEGKQPPVALKAVVMQQYRDAVARKGGMLSRVQWVRSLSVTMISTLVVFGSGVWYTHVQTPTQELSDTSVVTTADDLYAVVEGDW